ncbi:MAG: fatty acid desaturase [Paracoccaceae bacterium]|jgi:fatty acid desaturase|nr:fatty acid desaturase [Paracoccaceae bacterium]
MTTRAPAEWPTLLLLATCYALWGAAVVLVPALSLPVSIALAATAVAFHSSLTHEAIHGHPTRHPWLNAALVWPALGLFVPYGRFRDDHLAHHRDANLTDPYDDPESNYMDPAVFWRLPRPVRALLRANNTLVGRVTLGPAIAQVAFLLGDWRRVRAGDVRVRRAWAAHIAPAGLVVALVALSPMPLWAYLVAVYAGHGLVKIRTFLEHRAHEHAAGRTVVIEDRGPLALLFLNNNFHLVHHMHPEVPWYRLPGLYFARPGRYLRRNRGYRYASYAEVIRRHLLSAKDPVPHPLRPVPEGLAPAEMPVSAPNRPAAPVAPGRAALS